ncbi:MAG: hypothetical protein IPN66_07035 [Candidatus Competibacteraceae bacterium]|jgi:hypothetical protein|nr:hypothetical protein [Candidatus Competibacteraceae bacterium]MBK8896673.1 hypothetical protein [Candidatus Competibacteraceae bacterium]MBK8896877.1 hypothetical protein [Candidatus Competibacteraceae bacterium]MBK8896971.1 hypothetical protein [Candidatus Competibacteraceae bacterium]
MSTEIVAAVNPFAMAARSESALAEAGSTREAHEVQAMMVIAKRFPRDPVQSTDAILQACSRPTLAENSLYSYSRGGSEITGPSIRLAEAICQNWGNIDSGFKELARGIGPDKVGYSEVLSFAWDMQTNSRKTIAFRVRHWRDTKKGGYALTDERDIYELVANQASRRTRNCILATVPGDVVEAAQRQCELTLSAHADTSPEAIKKLVAAFSEFGVTREQIEKRIQRRLDTITPAQIISFKKIYASLRDGMSAPKDWFPDLAPTPGQASPVLSRLKEKVNESLIKAGAMPAILPDDPPFDPETGEITGREPGEEG